MKQRDIASLVDRLRGVHVDGSEGLARAEAILDNLGRTAGPPAVIALLPFVMARAWPMRSLIRSTRPHLNDRLADLALGTIEEVLSRMSIRDLLSLEPQLRAMSFYFEEVSDARWFTSGGISEVATGTHRTLALGLLSAHPSGYVRERVTDLLATAGRLALPWLLMRSIDWVPAVRTRARRAVEARLQVENATDFVGALPLIERLGCYTRVNSAPLVDAIDAFLREQPDSVIGFGLGHEDRFVRRATFALVDRLGRIQASDVYRALEDADVRVQLMAADWIRRDSSQEMCDLRLRLWQSSRGQLRAIALERMVAADDLGLRTQLEAGLVDAHRRVREFARYRIARAGAPRDFAEIYREQIALAPSVGAVRGLAEVGAKDDWELLVPLLDDRASLARAALRACRTLNRSATRELRLMMVDDRRRGVSKEAMRSIQADLWKDDMSAIRRYLSSDMEHVRVHALQLAFRMPGWIPARLLLDYDDPAHTEAINIGLVRWLSKTRAIRPPSAEVAAELRRKLLSNSVLASAQKEWLGELLSRVPSAS